MKKQEGFTLIELMVVMAIIAILATAGLSAYTGYIKGARDSARITIVRQLQTIVEALTTISGPPTPQQVADYLTAEGLAWNISTENPLLVDITESLVSAVGVWGVPNTLALIDDPVGGKAVCLDHEKNARMVCQFVYYKFSDGTYAISYGVELAKNLVNAHYSALPTPRTYGSFIGTSRAITLPPTTPTTNIESEGELANAGITVEYIATSVVPGGAVNGSSEHDGLATGLTCSIDADCNSGICYFSSLQCTSGELGASCDDNGDCLNNACNRSTSLCTTIGGTGASCTSIVDCQISGDVCRYNPWGPVEVGKFCGLPLGNNTPACDASDECESGLFCNYSATCSTGDVGAYCQYDSYCPVTGYCDTSSGLCATAGATGSSCNSIMDCSTSGDVCRYNPGSGGAGGKFCGGPLGSNSAPCDADDQCGSGLFCNNSAVCSTGDVGANCQNHSYCPVSGYCNTSIYVCSNGSSGDWCNSDTGCSSGTCENNICT